MHASLHAADDPDWLLEILTLVTCRTSVALTTDSPCDVDIKECEYGDDDAKDGSDEIFECQDPSRGSG